MAAFQRKPITLIVLFPDGAEAYDDDGHIRSYVNGSQDYVEQKISEYWPDARIERAAPGRARRSPH